MIQINNPAFDCKQFKFDFTDSYNLDGYVALKAHREVFEKTAISTHYVFAMVRVDNKRYIID